MSNELQFDPESVRQICSLSCLSLSLSLFLSLYLCLCREFRVAVLALRFGVVCCPCWRGCEGWRDCFFKNVIMATNFLSFIIEKMRSSLSGKWLLHHCSLPWSTSMFESIPITDWLIRRWSLSERETCRMSFVEEHATETGHSTPTSRHHHQSPSTLLLSTHQVLGVDNDEEDEQ